MGLDMYAYSRATAPERPVDFEHGEGDEEIFYWRKHPNLHGWMERLYRDKGGQDISFNCTPVVLTSEDLDQLEADIKENRLPETAWFFFGQSDPLEDTPQDLLFIRKARDAINRGNTVFYDSWW